MVDTTTSRFGFVAGGTTPTDGFQDANTALMLKVFSGEVLKVFDQKQITKDMVRSRKLSGAKEATFPIMGTASANFHEPGVDISDPSNALLNSIDHAEKVIRVDYPLVAPVFVSEWDEAINHYETRSEYSHQLGEALATTWDNLLLRVMASADGAAATVTGSHAGASVDLDSAAAGATEFIDAVFTAKQTFDERDVPMSERFLLVPPAWEIELIRSDSKLIDRDFSPSNGSYAAATVGRMAGMTIVVSNHIPWGKYDGTTGTGGPSNTGGLKNSDYAVTTDLKIEALAVQKQAVGQVNLWDMEVQHQYSALHQGSFLISRMSCGSALLRPECCVPIKNTAAGAVQGPQ